ncbi:MULTISPECIES: hypothetical protein [Brevibacillus]|jgi:hypothetical protein|uniref:Uncharacterized protein n=2 Tax=Brevibacillus borstelensis TaxID=45462 RepID=M8DK00_9BACL|nr:hypothetical protein [Brevibacillus borstelensis]EMT53782.1 hypothetical protein I532_07200 [Brevibacillus borstelensis AK1]MCC0562547.1 hypothetical protein [Brevibacillus borstelensis]MCM3469845.1 hypothetical protein [Brevibacillus borstelensis]MCM3561207.1 hypothetical protein [Brevibacillus borstelensis]MCM3620668.1 hypothetical protein [Brevibacillus borstelensis]
MKTEVDHHMLIDQLYAQLVCLLRDEGVVLHAYFREYAGNRFLYVTSPLPPPQLGDYLTEAGERIASGTIIHPECTYVRTAGMERVFRFRFLIPEDKKFCCGNLCDDCYLLRSKWS